MKILLAAGIALASLIQPSRPVFPGCEAITKLTNQYKLQDGSLKGEQSFTLNTLFYDTIAYFECPVLIEGAVHAFVTGPENGSEVYWAEQVMGAGLQKEEALQLFSSLSESYRKCYPDATSEMDLTPEAQDDLDIWAKWAFTEADGTYCDLWLYADFDAMFEDMLQDPESKATFFQVVLIIGRE